MNYLKIMPLVSTVAHAFSSDTFEFRSTLLGERAQPGTYTALLGDHNIRAEVTTAPGASLHRYTFPQNNAGRIITLDLSAAGLAIPRHLQNCRGLYAEQFGKTVEGYILTPPPVSATPSNATGLKLFFSVDLGASLESVGFWPTSLRGKAKISLSMADIAALGGTVGLVANMTTSSPVAEIRVGFSLRSGGTARANVAGVAAHTFNAVVDAAWNTWNSMLARVDVLDYPATPGVVIRLWLLPRQCSLLFLSVTSGVSCWRALHS